MATQVKHRRGNNTEILSGTPAIGELWFNTTDNSIHMGDGVTQGGIKHINAGNISKFTEVAYTKDYVDFTGTDEEIRTALDLCFSENSVIVLSAGVYPDYKIVHANKTLFSTKDTIFRLPDNTATTAAASMALEIAAIGITINGDITVDGNAAGNTDTPTDLGDRRGAFAVNHDRFTLNGDVIIPSAYWVGVSIGYEDKIAFDVEIERVRVIGANSYQFHAWACDRWKVGTIFVENNVQGFNNRIQTGTQNISGKQCKNGEIESIIALNTYCVFEVNTETLKIGNVFCAGGKTEQANDVTIGNFVSRGLEFDANGFTTIQSSNIHIDSLTVADYNGLQEEVVQFSDSSSDVTVNTLTVKGTKERVGNPRNDLVIYGGNGLYIGNAVLKDSLSVSGLGLFVNNITSMKDVVIDNVISRNHNGNDIQFNQFNDPEIQVNKVNSDAVSNISFTENVGTYDEQTATVALTPQAGTITMALSTVTVTKRDRMVTVNGTISASVGTPPVGNTGTLKITGLPFTCFNADRAESAITVHCQNLAGTFVGRVEGRILKNTNEINLWRVVDNNFFDLAQHIQGGTEITFSVTYPVR